MDIGELCTRETFITYKNSSIVNAAKLMRDHHVGNLVVVEATNMGNKPIGVLTDRDLVIEILAQEVNINSVCVQDIMSTNLLTANASDDVAETMKKMRKRGVRRVPVIDAKGYLIGIFAVDDMLDFIAEQSQDVVALISNEQRVERTLHN